MNYKQKQKRRRKSFTQKEEGVPSRPKPKPPTAYRHHDRQPQTKEQLQQNQIEKQKKHEEALALSQQLRQLSSQKRLKECIDLYRSPAYDELRDAHHGSIVVDSCARCGDVDEAEIIVNEMLLAKKSQKSVATPFFWEEHKRFSYKQVPIQAWTALLKGYVHSGKMSKADSLFHHLCVTHSSKVGADDGGKRKREGSSNNGPNVRTLNTLLRGCLWTATSLNPDADKLADDNDRHELVGGVMTAEGAWSLCEDINVSCDSSSYEYFISILSQSLQCQAAEDCLQKMKSELDITDCVGEDQVESMVVCLVVIARGYVLLGKKNDGRRCSEEALQYLDGSAADKGSAVHSSNDNLSTKRQTTGGKKAWKDTAPANAREEGGGYNGRREESNKLFRSHRLSELQSEVLSLRDICMQDDSSSGKRKQANGIATENASYIAQFMMTRLLYFSGGGTTDKDATTTTTTLTKANVEEVTQQWIHSLWHSFGLRETVQRLIDDKDKGLKSIFHPPSSKKQSKRERHVLPTVLSNEICNQLEAHIVGNDSVISSDSGRINFSQVFRPLDGDAAASQQSKKINIELGAGSGDWACLQAKLNPLENYVTVELRADRVAQTFAKCALHQQQAGGQSQNSPLTNVCCVGSECGSFLRDRVEPGSVKTIFVNHPEPPTQTYNAASTHNATKINTEEPAHMLNSQTILSAVRCLEPEGKGQMIIVTDNVIYARLICNTLVRTLERDKKLVGLSPGEVQDLRRIESFGHSSIHLYEGKPSVSIGHYTTQKFEGGTSYFDRLWRTGAGKHADMRKRYIIGLRTSGGSMRHVSKGVKSHGTKLPGKSKGPSEGNKPSKKKNEEKQKRRNERRLLKKQQLAQGDK